MNHKSGAFGTMNTAYFLVREKILVISDLKKKKYFRKVFLKFIKNGVFFRKNREKKSTNVFLLKACTQVFLTYGKFCKICELYDYIIW